MIKLSIVIPCYNPDMRLLERCINSVKNQTYTNYEVILVDDGSDQFDYLELKKIIDGDNRFQLITQTNKGVSAARNNGTNFASGEYITYLDADDYFNEKFFELAIEIITQKKCDSIMGGIARVDDSGTNIFKPHFFSNSFFDKYTKSVEEFNELRIIKMVDMEPLALSFIGRPTSLADCGCLNKGIHAKIFRTSIAKDTKFIEGIPFQEDLIWLLEMLNKMDDCILVNTIWYNYYVNSDSVTEKYDPKIVQRLLPSLKWLLDHCDLNDKKTVIALRSNILWALGRVMNSLLNNRNWSVTKSEKRKVIKDLYTSYPWIFLKKGRIYKEEHIKDKIKIISYRMHLFFFFFKYL